MIPSINQLTSGLSFAFSLLSGRPFDIIKSRTNISPLGLWHVMFFNLIFSVIAELFFYQSISLKGLHSRIILASIPLTAIKIILFIFFIFYLSTFMKRINYFYNFIISFLWLLAITFLIIYFVFPIQAVHFILLITGFVLSIQILISQFKIAKQLLDVSTLSAIGIVFSNIFIGMFVGYIYDYSHSFFM
jgi:hypothetical protein